MNLLLDRPPTLRMSEGLGLLLNYFTGPSPARRLSAFHHPRFVLGTITLHVKYRDISLTLS